MARKRGNPNWCKPTSIGPLTVSPPTFETVAQALGLAPKDFEGSVALKEWVNRNKDHKYVPLDLLEAWDLVPDLF
jgi:hypothetical protein